MIFTKTSRQRTLYATPLASGLNHNLHYKLLHKFLRPCFRWATNGVPIYSPYNGQCSDVVFSELDTLDYCLGHPSPQANAYHYHVMSYDSGLAAGTGNCPWSCADNKQSDIVAVMADGKFQI